IVLPAVAVKRMRARANAQVMHATPVIAVVLRLETGLAEVGHLELHIPMRLHLLQQDLKLLRRKLVFRRLESAFFAPTAQGSVGFYGQGVAGNMLHIK